MGRRVVVVALVWALVASLLALAPTPAAAAPGGCDADGDGVAGGNPETIYSDGSDEAAAALATDTGVVLGEAEAAHRWRVEVCAEPGGGGGGGDEGGEGDAVVRSVLGAPVQELKPEAAAESRPRRSGGVSPTRRGITDPGSNASFDSRAVGGSMGSTSRLVKSSS